MFRLGLAAAIKEMDGIELVGEAQRADQVAALVDAAAPDVLLLDVRLPDGSGLEVNRWLAEHHPEVRVVMLTMSEDLDTALTALRDGASGYLVKGAGPSGSSTRCGPSPPATWCSTTRWSRPSPSWSSARRAAPARPFPELTDREFDVLCCRRRARQHGDRPPARAQPEDGAQPRVQRVRQDPRHRSPARHRAGPPHGPRHLRPGLCRASVKSTTLRRRSPGHSALGAFR